MVATLTFHADAYPAGTRHSAHQHDELHLSLVLSGRVAETVASVTEWAGPLSVVAKDAGVVHANAFGPAGAKMARLTLPSGTIGALIDDPTRSTEWRWTHDAAVAGPYVQLVRRANSTSCTFDAYDPDLLDLLAALTAHPARPARKPPTWLVQVMEELRTDWHPGRSVADVARRAGVHPVYLARCVRRWYSTRVAEELRRLRLQSAATAIAERRVTLSDIAHSRGFADEPHLCREFRRAAGITPGRYRALVGSLCYTSSGRQ